MVRELAKERIVLDGSSYKFDAVVDYDPTAQNSNGSYAAVGVSGSVTYPDGAVRPIVGFNNTQPNIYLTSNPNSDSIFDGFAFVFRTGNGDIFQIGDYNSNDAGSPKSPGAPSYFYYNARTGEMGSFSVTAEAPICFCAGTLIRTVRGEVAVEELQVGDLVVTASGEPRPIRWIGRRSFDCTRHPQPAAVWPVRILAGAIAPGMPARDLLVSREHAILLDDVLIPVRHLINGMTIRQEPADTLTYWHVELDSHDVLLAEGLPAESYLDTGNRSNFANGGSACELHPDFAPRIWAENGCAPLLCSGERVEAARDWLARRAAFLGHNLAGDPLLRVEADGVLIAPLLGSEGRVHFALPEGCRKLRLVSRAVRPLNIIAGHEDHQLRGVIVSSLQINGVDVPLCDPSFGEGWYPAEANQRWTNGSAVLPVCRTLDVTFASLARFPTEPARESCPHAARAAA